MATKGTLEKIHVCCVRDKKSKERGNVCICIYMYMCEHTYDGNEEAGASFTKSMFSFH